jgi:hypothetical protein
MDAVIKSPNGMSTKIRKEIEEMKRGCTIACSDYGILFAIWRAQADEILYLLDWYRISFALTNEGVLHRDSRLMMMDLAYEITMGSSPLDIEHFYERALARMRNTEIVKLALAM